MTQAEVREGLIRVLMRVQKRSKLPCPALTGDSIPVKVLEKFKSSKWPVATTWLEKELGVQIPKNVHIFGLKKGGPPLTINQAADLVCKKSMPAVGQAPLAAE
jgi:hypothetical protein